MASLDTAADRNQEATVWVGGLDPEVTEELVWELMLQAGPVASVNMPRDKVTGSNQGFSFVEFKSEIDADYAMKIMNMVRLFGRTIKVNKASHDQQEQDIGANLFVGNLDPDVDEQLLYTTFSAFGQVLTAKVMYDETDGTPRGFGFVNFADFASADAAEANMNGQFLCNRPVNVSYAFKKGDTGITVDRHGSEAERRMAKVSGETQINKRFASCAPGMIDPHQPMLTPMISPLMMPFQMPMNMQYLSNIQPPPPPNTNPPPPPSSQSQPKRFVPPPNQPPPSSVPMPRLPLPPMGLPPIRPHTNFNPPNNNPRLVPPPGLLNTNPIQNNPNNIMPNLPPRMPLPPPFMPNAQPPK